MARSPRLRAKCRRGARYSWRKRGILREGRDACRPPTPPFGKVYAVKVGDGSSGGFHGFADGRQVCSVAELCNERFAAAGLQHDLVLPSGRDRPDGPSRRRVRELVEKGRVLVDWRSVERISWYKNLEKVYGFKPKYLTGDLFHEGGKTGDLDVTASVRAVQAAQQAAFYVQ